MKRLGSVQRKMPCVFVTEVKEEPSSKREHQPFKVLATETISHKALDADIYSAIPTEKVDGTCCYVTTYKDQPYLWARLDRKPNKQAEKRFKNFLHSKENPKGWVPVEKNNKQYCWHSSVVNYEFEIALVLKHHPDDSGLLEISAVPLSDLLEQTLELIGTNINGNPYGLGSKKHPLHLLIPHGAFQIRNLPSLKHKDLLSWFEGCKEGKIEGIVWHCSDGCLIKVHRHHLGLCWPIPDTYMNSRPVIINMNLNKCDSAFDIKCLFNHFLKIDNQKFARLKDIIFDV
ncbi:RNA ligase 1 isoform X3 [Symphalangus syndactylus]|uniref:RNA ligase 1 isoform X3 n=1 Tax=Symphalangus syndactylus TaxID=9590 RepID=UPI0030042C38